ncbi:flavodoxin [Candidatus Woesearchaeota archaeon CG10_big_fil_rev_8_21_14_0_10_44_13]|nr:MAG: flavodoxin [Candidatus Woesearchaeota archaeon CG10_big_fil_rev_8_21_14_0_10_44_13]
MKRWKCSVCGFEYEGEAAPEECPRCSSSSAEFKEFSEKQKNQKLSYDGKKFDVLLINGSSHKGHNTSILADIAEQELKRKKVSYKRFNLNELDVQHCWCCYSMRDDACTYPCRNQLDDVPALHEMLINSKAVIVASPINWNNISARLKDFLDRLTCIENLPLLGKKSPTSGKTLGIIVNGHEDGAFKTAMDIFIYFQQMGYILAPFGFAYKTHGADSNSETDNAFFSKNRKLENEIKGVVNNVVEMMKLDAEGRLKDGIIQVCE